MENHRLSSRFLTGAVILMVTLSGNTPAFAQGRPPVPTATPMSINAYVDRCVDFMGASPEYAHALAHSATGTPDLIAAQLQAHAPVAPAGKTLSEYNADGMFRSEAIILATMYLSHHQQNLAKHLPEDVARDKAVTDVKAAARLWCFRTTMPGAADSL